MANGKNTGAFIILSILALGGLGLSGYMFVKDQFLEQDTPQLIGVWDNLDGSGTEFNLTFEDIQYQNSDFFSLSTANDTFTLHQVGWYKFTILTTWVSLGPTYDYVSYLQKNGGNSQALFEFFHPTEIQCTLNTILYAYSDGDDVFNIYCYCSGLSDSFGVAGNIVFNAAYLEYVIMD